jgi:NAD-dependent DNA ligase
MLFLIATVLAVLFYLNYDEQRELATDLQEDRENLASDREMDRGMVAEILRKREDGEIENTVVGHLTQQMQELAKLIDPAADVSQARAAAEEAYAAVGERGGLARLVESLHQKVQQQQETIASLTATVSERDETLQAKIDSLQQVEAEYEQALNDCKDQMATLESRLSELQSGQAQQLEDAQERIATVRRDLNVQISEHVNTINRLQEEKEELERLVADLRAQLERKAGRNIRELRPDGKILRVVQAEDICYINLGSQEDVKPGISFSVYPAEGVPEMRGLEGERLKGKGSLLVTKVSENISECRITEQAEGDPIVEGDLVANVVYDSLRQTEFVVTGRFDIYGTTGQPTDAGADQVRQIIRRIGGRIADKVTVQTDYVVVGQAPPQPTQPPVDAQPAVFKVYYQRVEVYKDYQQVQSSAESMRIPILDAERFLAFIGYAPKAQ